MNTATPEQYLEVAKCFRDAAAQKTNDPEWYRFRVKEAVANALLDADAVSEYWPLARASDQVSEIRASAMRDAVGDLCGPGNQNCTYNLLYDIDGRTATPNYGLAAYAEAEAIGIDKYELDECSLILFPNRFQNE